MPVIAPSVFRPIGLVATLALLAALPLPAADPVPADPQAKPTLVPPELFTVPEGLEVTVWATSPLLNNPTNMDIDRDGRVWVAEGENYRSKNKRRPAGDRIVVLTDTDGDGKADKTQVFVQEPGLVAPLGVAVIDNKIVVAQPPDLIVYTDVNRNQVFDDGDTREVLLTGFNGWNHDHSLHSLTAGPDGLWYWNQGNTGAVFKDRSDRQFYCTSWYNQSSSAFKPSDFAGKVSADGHVYAGGFTARMKPDGTGVEIIGYNYRNSYEQAVTSLGDVFQNDNDDPPACRVSHVLEYGNAGYNSRDGKRSWSADQRPGQTTQVAEWRQDDPGTMPAGDVYGGGSPTGIVYYENGALGDQWRGLLLSGEPGRNTIFGYQPKAAGAGFKLERTVWLTTNPESKFEGSDFVGGKSSSLSKEFRPSDIAVGPDGAIYIADWFDGRVGGHQTLDDGMTGTIYRVAPKGFTSRPPRFDEKTIDGLITALESPAVNVRNIGFTGLKARGDQAIPALAALLAGKEPYFVQRAAWLLAQMGPAGVAKVTPLLKDADDERRLVAYRALRRAGVDVLKMAAAMAGDPSPAVRREVALTLRDVPAGPEPVAILAKIAKGFDGTDRSYLEAFGTGSFGKVKEVYAAVAKSAGAPESWSDAMGWLAWRLGAVESVPALKLRALSSAVATPQRKLAMDGLAFIQDQSAADAMIELASTKEFPHRALATWWCINRRGNEWREFGLDAALKARGIYDPDKVVITPIAGPPEPAQPTKLVPSEIAKLRGDAGRGKARVAVCYACHHIGSQGAEFGPNLTIFGTTQPADVVIDAIVNPSKDIAHGFEGSTVVTADGNIDGIVLSSGDPLIIKSMGGVVQTIPKGKVKEVRKFPRSLMLPADQMGLDAQALADISAYLASGQVK